MKGEVEPNTANINNSHSITNRTLGLPEHQLRYKLISELRAAKVELLKAPAHISQVVLFSPNKEAHKERKLIRQLCERYGVAPPTEQDNHFVAELGTFRINWERHTEYSTYIFYYFAPFDTPFAEPAINQVPKDWLETLPGEVISATHVALVSKQHPRRNLAELASLFASNTVMGAEVAAGRAVVWTDNQIHADGFGRILIHDIDLRRRQAARLLHRLLEIETYRILAMIPVPVMRSYIPLLAPFDERLAVLTERNAQVSCLEDEQELLNDLTKLAAEIEGIYAKTGQRTNASAVYYDIVKLRISELREARIQGLQMFHEFMEQSLSSAMGTCSLVNKKLETLSTRVERASSLLRARIEISMEKQSRDLLDSMDKRADLQLRLQQTVEGLSIVVLSYYLLGLVSYAFKAIKASGVVFDTELATGIAIPIVIATVFLIVRRIRHMVHKK